MEKKTWNLNTVVLVDTSGSDEFICEVARTSYSGVGAKSFRDDERLIDYLIRHRHMSPFEFPKLIFFVEAPIFVVRQWMRHRMGNFNEVSGRYSELNFGFYEPEEWRKPSATNKQGSERAEPDAALDEKSFDTYFRSIGDSEKAYGNLLENGVAREQARTVLPLATHTCFYWGVDLRNLLAFLHLRLDSHAQQEIREFAEAIYEMVSKHFPNTFNAWDNHVLHAENFAADELDTLKTILVDLKVSKTRIESLALKTGMRKSRVREFMAKL